MRIGHGNESEMMLLASSFGSGEHFFWPALKVLREIGLVALRIGLVDAQVGILVQQGRLNDLGNQIRHALARDEGSLESFTFLSQFVVNLVLVSQPGRL